MTDNSIIPVIISGGSGTRLWPLSTAGRPKQFHALIDGRTLFQNTVLRSQTLPGATNPLIVCNASHSEMVRSQLHDIEIEPDGIVLEPAARNTAPAIAAAAVLSTQRDPDLDPVLLVLPADHQIGNWEAWSGAVMTAREAAREGKLVTLGICPTRPDSGYGYISCSAAHGGWADVDRFVEKPSHEIAQGYVDSGNYLWNSGMFVFRAGLFLEELERHAPEMYVAIRATFDESQRHDCLIRLSKSFERCPAASIDYAVMEKTDKAAVVRLDAGWSDIGSWDAVHDLLPKDGNGNCLSGDVVSENSNNCLVKATHRKVGIVGLEGIVVVETEEAVLVLSMDHSQGLKGLVERIQNPEE